LAHIWGPGDLSSVKRLKNEVNELINEFLVSGDQDEVSNLNKHAIIFLKTFFKQTTQQKKKRLKAMFVN